MENETATAASLADFWPQVLLIALVAAAIGALIGIQIAKKQKASGKKLHISMEYSIMVSSGIITICAIFFQTFNMLEAFSSAVITAFSGVIFSWLLTKMSSNCSRKVSLLHEIVAGQWCVGLPQMVGMLVTHLPFYSWWWCGWLLFRQHLHSSFL